MSSLQDRNSPDDTHSSEDGEPPDAPRLVFSDHSVAATRAMLAAPSVHGPAAPVVGWVDITSPHLVDLLDELCFGPGGDRLVAIDAEIHLGDCDHFAIRRGLGTLRDRGVALFTLDAELRDRLIREIPGLTFRP